MEKELLPLLANTGGSVYNQTSSAADLCSNNNTLMWMEKIFMAGILTPLLRLLEDCLHALSTCFARWTKPLTSSLPLQTLADLRRSKSELVVENALLREQLIILKRQVKRPACTNTDRLLLVLLARLVRTWQQALVIVQPDTLLRWHRELFRWYWKRPRDAHQCVYLSSLLEEGAVGESAHPCELEAGGYAEMPISARSVEQAIPR